jgi:histidine triad (HIT) family protein
MAYTYDDQNIFAKILRGEIPCQKVHETAHSLAFNDINPQAPVHVLVIPKGAYTTFDHFAAEASEVEMADYVRAIGHVAEMVGCAESAGGNGWRLLANAGADAHQEVPHLHVHVVGGKFLGPFLRVPN